MLRRSQHSMFAVALPMLTLSDERRVAATAVHAGEEGLRGSELELPGDAPTAAAVTTCAWCQRTRDEDRLWNKPGEYIRRAFLGPVSHGMCPQCAQTWVDRS